MDDLSQYTQYLGEDLFVKIDRPKGSTHPRLDFVYETNYGFLPNTVAGDGHEIDVWVLEQDTPLTEFEGKCIAVIVRKDDDENKLVVANRRLSKERILEETRFVEGYYDTEVILLPEAD